MRIGVLALQGAFAEHIRVLTSLGAECVELRQSKDLEQELSGIVLPGGESTVQGKLLRELKMFEPLKKMIEDGMPVLATCAGMILLAERIEGQDEVYLQTLPVTVKRNAYGRQLDSFYAKEEFGDVGKVPMSFIRAPYITEVEDGVRVLSKVDENVVGVQYKNQIAVSFHPELDEDVQIHEWFCKMCG